MNISFLFFIQIWIILYLIYSTETSDMLNRLENTTDTGVIDLKRKISKPVSYNLNQWLANKAPNFKRHNLIILPVLAVIAFLWILCLKVCKWIREDSKFDERGCSYDVTSFVILTQQDTDFDDLDMTVSPLVGVYDTVSSYRDLQNRIDTKMYDTVTSYASLLKQNAAWNARLSPTESVKLSANRCGTPDKEEINIQSPTKQQYQKRGRFYVVPAIDNYMRLKNSFRENGLQHSSSSSTLRSMKRGSSPFGSYKTKAELPSKRTKKLDRQILVSKVKRIDKRDVAVQVNRGRTKRQNKKGKKKLQTTKNSRPNSLRLNNDSLGKDQYNSTCQKVVCEYRPVQNHVFYTTALVHANAPDPLYNGNGNDIGNHSCCDSVNDVCRSRRSDEYNNVSSNMSILEETTNPLLKNRDDFDEENIQCRKARNNSGEQTSQKIVENIKCCCKCNRMRKESELNHSPLNEGTKNSLGITHCHPLETSTPIQEHCLISKNELIDSFEICGALKQTDLQCNDCTSLLDPPIPDRRNNTELSGNISEVVRTFRDNSCHSNSQGHDKMSSPAL